MKNPWIVNLLLLLVAFIWGVGFVPQREGLDYFSPLAFNSFRFALGALTLVPLMLLLKSVSKRNFFNLKSVYFGGILGLLLFGGAAFQQVALKYTSVANVAFITGIQVIIVPMLGYFLGMRYTIVVWLGGLFAIVGLYLMTGSSGEISLKGDVLAFIGAFFWALHLLIISRFVHGHNQLVLAFFQFLICSILSLIVVMILGETLIPSANEGYIWVAINGILVVGIAYTLQVVMLKYADAFTASIIFTLEAVFGALAGYFVYLEKLTEAGITGAALMLIGCILAQIPQTNNKQQG